MLRRCVEFQRRLREQYPGVAWVRVFERHRSGAVHVHYGVSRFIPKADLARLWGHGFVDVRKIRTKLGGGEDGRAAARYLAKYIGKGAESSSGHAYEVAQGFAPAVVRARLGDADGAFRAVVALMGGEVPSYVWESGTVADWRGPPVVFLGWS